MIKLRNLICELIAERMSFSDLMKSSDPQRIDKSKRIPAKSLVVKSLNDKEAWKFSYKTPSDENTTGQRHQGFIYFFKEDLQAGDNALLEECSVDCSCPDYKYRWAYNNARVGSGELGGNTLNKNNGSAPKINLGVGLCKHLISLHDFLKTKIESEPTPPDEPKEPIAVPAMPDPRTVPPEEPEIEPDRTENDPTQTPEQEQDKENPLDIAPELEDPTQTPQEPKVSDDQEIPDVEQNPKNQKKKLKENPLDKTKLISRLNDICSKNRIFIVNYY